MTRVNGLVAVVTGWRRWMAESMLLAVLCPLAAAAQAVPGNAPTGPAVPIVLSVGSGPVVSSQPGVTIAVQ